MVREKILKGIAAANGIAQGSTFVYESKRVDVFKTTILSVYLKDESERFGNAINKISLLANTSKLLISLLYLS